MASDHVLNKEQASKMNGSEWVCGGCFALNFGVKIAASSRPKRIMGACDFCSDYRLVAELSAWKLAQQQSKGQEDAN